MTSIPLVLHASLGASGFIDYLGSGFKIRVSSSTPQDSVILPTCGIAILIVNLARVSFDCDATDTLKAFRHDAADLTCPQHRDPGKKEEKEHIKSEDGDLETMEQLCSRIDSFARGHRISVVVLVGWVFVEESIGGRVMDHLQKSLMPSPPLIVPAHGDAQVAVHIQILSKVCKSEMRIVVRDRMEEILSTALKREQNIVIGRAMGLGYHQASVLMDTFGSIGGVAMMSATEIHKSTPLDAASAAKVAAFLDRDTVSL